MQISQGVTPSRSPMAPRLKERPKTQPNRNQYKFTPAEKHRLKMAQQSILNPQNEANRQTMHENFGIQLPLINNHRGTQSKLFLGSNVEPLASLPMANRKDPQLAPPNITEEDARHGILSLLERGLIPPGADLTFEPSPVKHKLAQIYNSEDRRNEKMVIADSASYNLAGLKLRMSGRKHRPALLTNPL
ncbi:IQ domain-containing protein H-like [Watersipora subatra]|uniref:IQ domain-containing protein H-like n=1 Tax=Watersipora subatra TaxID=2589382 RepID=UPI00355B3DBC